MMIEYIAAMVSFLMPFYLAAMIYEILKSKSYDTLNIVKVVGCVTLIGCAYLYLEPKQRYMSIGLIIVLALSLTITIAFGRLFRK